MEAPEPERASGTGVEVPVALTGQQMLVERAEVEVLHLDFQEELEEHQQLLIRQAEGEGVHRRSMGLVDQAVKAATGAVMLPD
jgi:hypothetical protein